MRTHTSRNSHLYLSPLKRRKLPRETGRPIPITPRLYRIFKDMEKMREDPTDREALIFPSVAHKYNTSRSRIASQTLIRTLRDNLGIELEPPFPDEDETAKAERLRQCAEINARIDLTRDDKIRAKMAAGMTVRELTEEYGFSRGRVYQIAGPLPENRHREPQEEWVNHAFRTALKDWLLAETDFDLTLWRAQVDHELGETQADNRYGSNLLLEKRRRMMLQYENFIDNPPRTKPQGEARGVNVLPFNHKRTA